MTQKESFLDDNEVALFEWHRSFPFSVILEWPFRMTQKWPLEDATDVDPLEKHQSGHLRMLLAGLYQSNKQVMFSNYSEVVILE